MPLHKLVADVEAETMEDLFELMCENDFIMITQRFHNRNNTGETVWEAVGPIILSTFHIAKVQEYVEKDSHDDERMRPPARLGPRQYQR